MGFTILLLFIAIVFARKKVKTLNFDPEWLKENVETNTTHYGDPATGCESDEQSVQVQGVSGDFCSPPCTGILHMKCPSDVPDGVTAKPQCALQDSSSGDK